MEIKVHGFGYMVSIFIVIHNTSQYYECISLPSSEGLKIEEELLNYEIISRVLCIRDTRHDTIDIFFSQLCA